MSSVAISLCLNCLQRGDVKDVPVGPDRGSQRDPYRVTLSLCPTCEAALVEGDFATLHRLYQPTATVER